MRMIYRGIWPALAVGAGLGVALLAQSAAVLRPDATPVYLDRGAAGLARVLAQLGTRASMLHVTAHPDDEDGGMLAMQSRGLGARTTLMTLTRGEGGQNAMSNDMYDALGLVRTQELLQAGRYYGVQQYWGREIDYGFSKTREEALEKWGYDRTLSDVVRVIRMVRPLVVTSVFVGAPTDGHGNHQVAGQMAQEAWVAAADPQKFPEQIREGLRPWAPLKVYERVPSFTPTKDKTIYDYATDKYVPLRFYDYVAKKWIETKPATNLTVPEGTWNAPTGLTYQQVGREGWGFQKSQNGGAVLPPPGTAAIAYHRYGSRLKNTAENETSFYDGIDVRLTGIADLEGGDASGLRAKLTDLNRLVEETTAQYRPEHPAAIAGRLAEGLRMVRAMRQQVKADSDAGFELGVKEEQFQSELLMALGVHLEANVAPEKPPTGPFASFAPPQPTASNIIPGQKLFVQATLLNGAEQALELHDLQLHAPDGPAWTAKAEKPAPAEVAAGALTGVRFEVQAPADAPLTRAYFTRPNKEQPYYDVTEPRYRNQSLAPYPLAVSAELVYDGIPLHAEGVVQTNTRVEGIGVLQNPLLVAPAISVSVTPAAGAVPLSTKSFTFTCTVRSNVKDAKGTVRLEMPPGWQSLPERSEYHIAREGETQTISFSVTPGTLDAKSYVLKAVAELNGKSYAEGYQLVGYPGVRPYPLYGAATYKATAVDVTVAPGLHVGYIPGTGDDLPRAMADLRVPVRVIGPSELDAVDLSAFDTIVLGVRAYQARPELRAANRKLLQYVAEGGVLVVQYQTANFDENQTPYPLSLGSNPEKVVDEFSIVKLLHPQEQALSWPNKITKDDFANWEEERGHGFVSKWDSKYVPLVETHDPDQSPQEGGLLVAHYGKGLYVYDAFALHRQLPAGVGGAYRLLANLISLGKRPDGNGHSQTAQNPVP